MPRKTDKRIRLIEAAMVLIHQQSFNLTTLADIAHKADVPLGNVYYYFKKKEDIGEAVIEKLAATLSEMLKQLDEISQPLDRLKAFIRTSIVNENLEQVARYGCSIGGLCQELSKQSGQLADRAAKLLHDMLQWAQVQFNAIGCAAESANFALSLVSGVQGSYLLTHTFKDPQFSIRQADILLSWLDRVKVKQYQTAKSGVEEEVFV
jgi:AcrR family transcriptional regulator